MGGRARCPTEVAPWSGGHGAIEHQLAGGGDRGAGPHRRVTPIPHTSVFERAPAPGAGILAPAEIEARVAAMLPLVRHVVADVATRVPRFVDRDELISAGMLGLTQAAHSYDV